MEGWIKLHRCLQKNWLWNDKPFSKGQAWIDMLMMANHETHRITTRTGFIDIDRGSFHTEERTLEERWGWSRSKVRCFLQRLTSDKMVSICVKKSTTGKTTEGTTVTIEKYSDYQGVEPPKKPPKKPKEKPPKDQRETNGEPKQELLTPLEEEWNNFKEMRLAVKKPMTDHAEDLMQRKLEKLSGNVDEQVEILRQSIMNNWTDIYPLKGMGQSQHTQGTIIDSYHPDSPKQKQIAASLEAARLENEKAKRRLGL